MIKSPFTFQFDEWAKLYCVAPDAFEEKRRTAIRLLIEAIPQEERKRLEAM
jgi:hypothetical protein